MVQALVFRHMHFARLSCGVWPLCFMRKSRAIYIVCLSFCQRTHFPIDQMGVSLQAILFFRSSLSIGTDACFVCETESSVRSLPDECRCQRCSDVIVSRLNGPELHRHMGAHILHDPYFKDADNPCGLCLNTGSRCVFRLVKCNKVDQIDMTNSRCPNLYKIQLSSASKYSKSSPCTNGPLRCPLCPKESNCIWKYNMHAHILEHHPSANIELYHSLFALADDESVLMKGTYLTKSRKSKKKAKGFRVMKISEGHSSRLALR